MESNTGKRLSVKAFSELKRISGEEFDMELSDHEIEEMGMRLLRILSILLPDNPEPVTMTISFTQQESDGINFIHEEIHRGRSPSVRQFSWAMGLRSSRSGHRLLNRLMEQGWIYRNDEGKLCLTERIKKFLQCKL